MSLIQAALNKTQNKNVDFPEVKKGAPARTPAISDLKDFDREVEKKILEVQKPQTAQAASAARGVRFFIFFGIFCFTAFLYWSQNRPTAEQAPPLTVSLERSVLTSKPELARQVQQKVFAPISDPANAQNLFYLTGIAWGGSQPYAVINGQVLRVGDKLDQNIFVQAIEKEHVVLDYRGELIRLALRN